MKPKSLFIPLLMSVLISACRINAAPVPTATRAGESSSSTAFLSQVPGTVRVLNYNVGWDSIFPDGDPLNDPFRTADKSEAFRRILQAVQPQVLCLQEINPRRNPAQVADLLNQALPLEGDGQWQVHNGGDNFIAAIYDLRLTDAAIVQGNPFTGRGHAMALVDLPDGVYPADLYLVCAHFKSQGGQSNINARQAHADTLVAWIRDLKSPGGEVDLPTGTPFTILGDLNVYDTDPAHHLVTLLSGDIANEEKYGPDTPPDWDGSDLADALPRHNLSGSAVYTWRDDTQDFNPGILDRILYTDSVITIEHGFILNTNSLSPEALSAAGLQVADVLLEPEVGNYDHLPLVVDLSFQPLGMD